MSDVLPVDWPAAATPSPPLEPGLSAMQRLTLRQADMVAKGRNPLRGEAHPNAPTDCTRDAPRGRPFTCGTCAHRDMVFGNSRDYPKCLLDGLRSATVTHGPQTDCRAWWPACKHYEPTPPREGATST